MCEPVLDLDLDWRALRPIDADLVLVIQLVTAVPGGTELRLNYNHWPGWGNAPTTTWPTDRVVRDRYRLPLPPSTLPTQAWQLHVALIDPDTGDRLPVQQGTLDGGDALTLSLLRVPGPQSEIPGGASLPMPVSFSPNGAKHPAIELVAAEALGSDGEWTVRLVWDCLAPVNANLVTFVHAYDAAGNLLSTGDGPPRKGAFPTHLWEPDDRIASTHTLSFAADAEIAQIAVGLYVPESGVRLSAALGDTALPNDAAVIWPIGEQD